MSIRRWLLAPLLACGVLLQACTGLPPAVQPVAGFDLNRYLGKWYEIARLDHSFERGLQRVTAQYSVRVDGGVNVVNRGFNINSGKWKQAEGRARFVGDSDSGHLKVSFFGPFYGSYAVFELDPEYRHAFVSGYSTNYLWLLSRTPQIDARVVQRFVARAESLGFDSEALIFVEH